MRPIFFFLILTSACFASEKSLSARVAKVYAIGKTDQPPVFTHTTKYKKNDAGQTLATVDITDPKGEVVFHEESVYEGTKLVSQIVDQFQTKEHFEVTVKGSKLYFDGKESEDIEDNFIAGPTLENYIIAHWNELLDGETVHARLAVPERKETFGFKFWVRDKTMWGDREVIRIGMKPKSIIVAAFFGKALNLFFDVKDKTFVKFEGRTTIKIKEGDSLEPLDAEIKYD